MRDRCWEAPFVADVAAGALVIKPAVEGVVVPVVGRLTLALRERLVGLQWVIDNNDVSAPARQHTSYRSCQPESFTPCDTS